jgi:periplasmic protein TonB
MTCCIDAEPARTKVPTSARAAVSRVDIYITLTEEAVGPKPSLAVRRLKNCMGGRSLPAFGVSAIVHAALFLVLTFTFQQTDRRQPSRTQPPVGTASLAQLVWLAVPGHGGGGGGGGNRMPEPPRRLQRPGGDTVSTPRVNIRAVQSSAEPSTEEAPVLALASANVTLPGAIESGLLATLSLGPGGPNGTGRGNGDGIGEDRGRGLGPGRVSGVGGPNGRGGRLVMPTVLRDVKPRYTTEAMRARIEGAVVVSAIVQADGTVRDVQVLRSLDPVFGLDQAAINAARQWLFRPGLMAGLPVPVAITIELSFNLR